MPRTKASGGRSSMRPARLEPPEPAPSFFEGFPEDEALALAVAAFQVGNFAEVRTRCAAILEKTDDEVVRQAASELRRRIEPDRLVVGVLWGSFALLALIVLWAYSNAPR